MQIVIDIDEDYYEIIKHDVKVGHNDYFKPLKIIANGAPLPKNHWIPVNEQLPEFNDLVLASTKSDYSELKVIITAYNAEEYWFNGKIEAWMPLPKPYIKKEE